MDDIEIDIVHGDRSPKHVPIYIAATTGMKMMELAGEIGDGVLLNYLVGPGYNREAMAHLAAGAARAGRTIDDVDRPQLVVCSLDADRSLALDRARELVTQYLGQQPHIGKASGVDASLLEEIGRIFTWPATPGADRAGDGARARRRRPADHRVGHRGRVPGEGAGVRRRGLHLPGAVPARRRRPGDDRRVRDGDGADGRHSSPRSLDEALELRAALPRGRPGRGRHRPDGRGERRRAARRRRSSTSRGSRSSEAWRAATTARSSSAPA